MADVLSQSQIDALLNSMQNADMEDTQEEKKAAKPKYRKYDFYSPKKYTKDKLKMLHSIYDNYSRVAASQISGLFRIASEVEVVGVEEQRYYEFGNALNETDIITLARVDLQDHSKNPPMLFHVAPILMGTMMDRMLGGTGIDTSIDMAYTYTEIELALYEKIIRQLIGITSDVWAGYIKFDTVFEKIEENPSMFQGISVDETVVIVMMKITLGAISGVMNICIPGALLGNIFDIIEKTKHLADKGERLAQRDNRRELLEGIKEAKMDVRAELCVANMSLNDIYNLRVGDVIDLNKPQDSDVAVHIEGQQWFAGQLGVYNKNMAVKIRERVGLAGEEQEEQETVTEE